MSDTAGMHAVGGDRTDVLRLAVFLCSACSASSARFVAVSCVVSARLTMVSSRFTTQSGENNFNTSQLISRRAPAHRVQLDERTYAWSLVAQARLVLAGRLELGLELQQHRRGGSHRGGAGRGRGWGQGRGRCHGGEVSETNIFLSFTLKAAMSHELKLMEVNTKDMVEDIEALIAQGANVRKLQDHGLTMAITLYPVGPHKTALGPTLMLPNSKYRLEVLKCLLDMAPILMWSRRHAACRSLISQRLETQC